MNRLRQVATPGQVRLYSLLRLVATRLHRVASLLNEQAYRLEHGVECGVIRHDPLGALRAEIRQRIRDKQLDPGQGGEGTVAIDGGKLEAKLKEGAGDQLSAHAPADRRSIDDQIYSSWTRFLDQRAGPRGLQARETRR